MCANFVPPFSITHTFLVFVSSLSLSSDSCIRLHSLESGVWHTVRVASIFKYSGVVFVFGVVLSVVLVILLSSCWVAFHVNLVLGLYTGLLYCVSCCW